MKLTQRLVPKKKETFAICAWGLCVKSMRAPLQKEGRSGMMLSAQALILSEAVSFLDVIELQPL